MGASSSAGQKPSGIVRNSSCSGAAGLPMMPNRSLSVNVQGLNRVHRYPAKRHRTGDIAHIPLHSASAHPSQFDKRDISFGFLSYADWWTGGTDTACLFGDWGIRSRRVHPKTKIFSSYADGRRSRHSAVCHHNLHPNRAIFRHDRVVSARAPDGKPAPDQT